MKKHIHLAIVTFALTSCMGGIFQSSEEKAYALFWDAATRIDVELTMAQDLLDALQTFGKDKNDQYNDYYFPASLKITVNETLYEIDEVGIRQKGNIFSRGPFLDDAGYMFQAFHFRLSFDQTFDEVFYEGLGIQKTWMNGEPDYEARQKRRFFGMKSLEFKWNRSNDPSLINQVYASQLYLENDAIAPRSTLAKVSLITELQGQDVGMFTINEAVDQIFIERHFSGAAAQGDLYKALWSNQLLLNQMAYYDNQIGDYVFRTEQVGIEDTEAFYHPVYDLKTNQNTSQHEHIMALVKTLSTLNNEPSVDRQKSLLNDVVDVESFLQYAAISHLSGNPDDMRNLTNNTYIYFHGVTGQAYFIPYDMDWSLGVTWDANLTEKMATHSAIDNINSFDQIIENPLYWYTMFEGFVSQASRYPRIPGYQAIYLNHIQTVIEDTFFSTSTYQSLFDLKQRIYENDSFTLPSNSIFDHTDLFAYHHQGMVTANPS